MDKGEGRKGEGESKTSGGVCGSPGYDIYEANDGTMRVNHL